MRLVAPSLWEVSAVLLQMQLYENNSGSHDSEQAASIRAPQIAVASAQLRRERHAIS